jgi:hypothetical protein
MVGDSEKEKGVISSHPRNVLYFRRRAETPNGRSWIPPDALSPVVVNPKLNQCVTVTRVSSLSEPFESIPQVAVFSIGYCDVLCSAPVSGSESLSQPQERFRDVLSDSISIAEQNSPIILRRSIAVFGGALKPVRGFHDGRPHNHLSPLVLASVRVPVRYFPFCFPVATRRSRQQ